MEDKRFKIPVIIIGVLMVGGAIWLFIVSFLLVVL